MGTDGRLDALDGLRGLAAFAVVLFHFLDRGPGLYPEIGNRISSLGFASYGVNLFFVISGFVIFMTLERSTARRFVASRFIRLYPVYWLCVAITFSVVAVFGLPGREVSPLAALVNLTMFQEYVGVPHVDGAYWTLTAELAFYLVCLVLIITGLRSRPGIDVVLPVWLVVSAGAILADRYVGGTIPALMEKFFGWSPLFIAGILLYGIWAGDRRPWRILLLPAALLVMGLREPIEALVGAVVIGLVCLAVWGPRVGLSSAPLRWLGTISFALYLLHQNLGYVMLRAWAGPLGQPLATVLALAVVLALATAVTYLFDIPVRRALRRKLLPREDVRGT